MKRYIGLLGLLLFAASLYAQPPGGGRRGGGQPSIEGKITGTLIDSLTLESVPYASILLREGTEGPQKDGALSEDDGSFKFKDVPVGKYTLEISFVGFEARKITVETTPEKPDANLGTIFLSASAVLLEGVTVTEEAALIENRIDKLVYNADKDAGLAGADATELLRKVPMLSVDLEGNVSLRGSSNIRILINGKPSALLAENPADVLQTIPAEQIKSVEVITTPTAKYDGEGSGGIINIITKKSEIEGFSGSVGGSVGNRSNNYNLNLSAAFGRFGLNANGGGWYAWPQTTLQEYSREDYLPEGTSTIFEMGEGISERLGFRGSASAYYDFNAYNSLTTSISLRGFNRFNEGTTQTAIYDAVEDDADLFDLISDTENRRSGYEWTTDYRKKFKKKDQELSLAFQWDSNRSIEENDFTQTDLTGVDDEINQSNINQNFGDNNEYTAQLDYVHPVGDWLKIETGARGVLRRIDSEYDGFTFNYATEEFESNPDFTDIFYYEQDVYAGYLSGTFKFSDKWGLVAGARYEYTDISSRFELDAETSDNQYQNVLPSFIMSYKPGQTSNIKLSYTRRIQRPGLRYVNPYNSQVNSYNRSIGNPYLQPEIVDQIELSYGNYFKGIALNTSLFYRYTSDIIEPYVVIEEGVAVTNYQNIGTNQSIGINIFASANIKKFLTLRGGFDVFTYNGAGTVNGTELTNQAILFKGNFGGTLNLPKDFKVEAFGFYSSPRQSLQGRRTSFYMYSFGLKKEFWDGRASLGIRAVQPFQKYLEFENNQEGTDFSLSSSTKIPFRSFGLSFSYKFGKLDFRDRPRRSKINGDDLKGDGDDGNQGF
ncbi:MAG: TonB-dependent receptor [Bacteroidetes bacterium]|nr:TonB-dependent receptor [Bacteroidota bacterium]